MRDMAEDGSGGRRSGGSGGKSSGSGSATTTMAALVGIGGAGGAGAGAASQRGTPPGRGRKKKVRELDRMLEEMKRSGPPKPLSAAHRMGGFGHAYGDLQTTNLYVGNLAPTVTEELLQRKFGRYGDLISVKVMWPRTEEERMRRRNSGFVAYRLRADAEKALEGMQEYSLEGYTLRIGWAKAVPHPERHTIIRKKIVDKSAADASGAGGGGGGGVAAGMTAAASAGARASLASGRGVGVGGPASSTAAGGSAGRLSGGKSKGNWDVPPPAAATAPPGAGGVAVGVGVAAVAPVETHLHGNPHAKMPGDAQKIVVEVSCGPGPCDVVQRVSSWAHWRWHASTNAARERCDVRHTADARG